MCECVTCCVTKSYVELSMHILITVDYVDQLQIVDLSCIGIYPQTSIVMCATF